MQLNLQKCFDIEKNDKNWKFSTNYEIFKSFWWKKYELACELFLSIPGKDIKEYLGGKISAELF